MATKSFTMRLPTEVGERLEVYSQQTDRSQAYIATKAIIDYLNRYEIFVEEVLKAKKQVKKGEFVSQKQTEAWLDSLGTKDERTPPKPDVFL